MKYTEFENKIKDLGKDIEYFKYRIRVITDGDVLVSIHLHLSGILNIENQDMFSTLDESEREELLTLSYELAMTKPKDRVELQEYLVVLFNDSEQSTVLCRDENRYGNKIITTRKIPNYEISGSKWVPASGLLFFTEKEIKKYNKLLFPDFTVNKKNLKDYK